jgi:hypothetical protein
MLKSQTQSISDFQEGLLSGKTETLDFPFELKKESVKEDGSFQGYASAFGGPPDSYGDIVEPGAFQTSIEKGGHSGLGIAMLWQHIPFEPIGAWQQIQEDSKGLNVEGLLAVKASKGNDAYQLARVGAVRGLSIGFNTVKYRIDETKKVRYLEEVDLWEISLVTFPAAGKRASVSRVKSIIQAVSPRELEKALREAGLSHSEAKYLVSLCRPGLGNLRDAEDSSGEMDQAAQAILKSLRETNASLEVFKEITL